MSQGRTRAAQLLKFFLGGAFLFWMVHSGRLDVLQVFESLARWPTLMAMLSLLYLQCAVTAWRWNLLLRAQEIWIPYRRAFGLAMIGLLFNLVSFRERWAEMSSKHTTLRARLRDAGPRLQPRC
jgi:lysylphosphatidylglycerol synthase-like protein